MKRKKLLEDFLNLLVNRQKILLNKDMFTNLKYWEKEYDVDTPLINDIIRLTEEYTQKYLNGQGCMTVCCLIVTVILFAIWGGIGLVIGIIFSAYTLNHIETSLFGPTINKKDIDLKKIIEKKLELETKLKKHVLDGSIIPEEFANVKAIRQAQKIIIDNPTLTPKEVYIQLRLKKEAYANSLTKQQKTVLTQLPYQIKSFYIFSNGRAK